MDDPANEQTAIDSLYRISSLVSDTEDPKTALRLILDEIIKVLKPSSASIALINPDTKGLELEASYGLPEDWSNLELALGQGITGWTALHGRALIVGDVRNEPRYISVRPSVRSEMAVPMEDQGMVIGVVNVDSEQTNAFGESALKILTLLTNEATRVVSRLWMIKQLRAKANQLESLVDMSQQLVGELDSDELMEALTRQARHLMDCHSSALFLLSPDGRELHLHSFINPSGPVDEKLSLPLEDSALGATIHRRKQIEVHDLAFTEENDSLRTIQREGLISMLASPIIFGEEVIGVIIAYTDQSHRFNNDEKNAFTTLAGVGAIAIQNARHYSRIFASEESMRRNEKLTTLGMLAAEIAHEIRNPLTVIKLLFDSLDLKFTQEDPRHTDVQVIGEKLNQLEEIVERVLSFGRTREGMHTRQDLSILVNDTLKLVRLKLHQQKITLEFEPPKKKILVAVNKGQMLQVMLNLVLNATQAMPDGGRIRIEATTDESCAHLTITDNGSGIPEAIQADIFESFLTDRPDGTGLGLSISKRILRDHRGNIELAHSSPEGTSFHFWLPLA
ncbi:GAF domain-containing protein [Coraliomargarita algicola]|uniref:histidine kinase n=1 Tax=Coraliomargarita algicola TaxID=3092156 RepID=A0ABZ0RMK8_9BACT|nr:GAF domain-containing protein [Coraliomargarita sp. J2-16]WPJ94174.1 GAF domain-containing protein [Coraliomargarita sp. J2-16]